MSKPETIKDLARLLEAIQAGARVDPTLTTRIRVQDRAVAASPQEASDIVFIEGDQLLAAGAAPVTEHEPLRGRGAAPPPLPTPRPGDRGRRRVASAACR